ncbi:putative cytochrome P450 6a17 [Vespula squamosa]|uniref:Cytochrome P450 6a17 n=1 Tax=Vespula squamosa TaxID=30214 RepID=A0ABD2B7U5_VESSQ
MAGILEILCGLAMIIVLLYYYLTSTFHYWKVRGVKGPPPIPLFGNLKDVVFHKMNVTEFLLNVYNSYKDERFIGFFYRSRPVLLVKDPQLLKDILIKDFSSFTQRALNVTEKVDPLSQNLIFLETVRWRPLRNKMTPAFSFSKIKEMFPLILTCSNHLEQYINELPDNVNLEIGELMTKYTIDIVGNCAFGIEMNAISEEENEFTKISKEIFRINIISIIKFHLQSYFPKIYNQLHFLLGNSRQSAFFLNIVKETMDYRKKNNIVRHDFINILMELKRNPGKLGEDVELTDSLCAAQAFVFFAAGSETSSLTMTYTLYELAQNQNIQDKLRKEINEEYEKNNGTLKYESVKAMKYLQAAVKEALRKHPPITNSSRECMTPSYTFRDTNLTIYKHQIICIPMIALHRDPSIFPNPDVYDPERFMNENNEINDGTYLPFGRGPRNCIGERFAEFQVIIGLAAFLRNCKVDVCEKTEIPYKISGSDFMLIPMNGIYLNISKINKG